MQKSCNKDSKVLIQPGNEKFWHVKFIKRFMNKAQQVVEDIDIQVFRTKREVNEALDKPRVLGFTEANIIHDPELEVEEKKSDPDQPENEKKVRNIKKQ